MLVGTWPALVEGPAVLCIRSLYLVLSHTGHVPPGVDPEAFSWFQSVDADHSGYITTKELKQALVNSNWSAFSDDTCFMMMSKFWVKEFILSVVKSMWGPCNTVGLIPHQSFWSHSL